MVGIAQIAFKSSEDILGGRICIVFWAASPVVPMQSHEIDTDVDCLALVDKTDYPQKY